MDPFGLTRSVMALRETGSILVRAPRERVFEALQKRFATRPGTTTVPDERIESRQETLVLQDAPQGGTRVVLGRTATRLEGRDDLRQRVATELLAIQKLVE